jgi:hypothetical protein
MFGVDVAAAEVAGFGDTQAGTVGTEQHHAVFRLPQGAEDLRHFPGAGNIEQHAGHLRVRDLLNHLGAVQGDGVEELEGGHLHLEIGRAVVEVAGEVQQVGAHLVGAERCGRAPVVGGQMKGAAQVLGTGHVGHALQQQISLHAVTQFSHETPPVGYRPASIAGGWEVGEWREPASASRPARMHTALVMEPIPSCRAAAMFNSPLQATAKSAPRLSGTLCNIRRAVLRRDRRIPWTRGSQILSRKSFVCRRRSERG